MLISTKEEIDNTFFFCSAKLPISVRKYLNHYCFPVACKSHFRMILIKILIRIFSNMRWPFLKTAAIYGGDNFYFSSELVKNRKMTLIEDGLWNYSFQKENLYCRKLRKLLFGNIACQGRFGVSDNVTKIILTGIKEVPEIISKKVVLISVEDIWNASTVDKKDFILGKFNCNNDDILFLQKFSSIVLTQPLSEDGFMDEKDKIEIYKNLLNGISTEGILFKKHPRDKTDYTKYFTGISMFEKCIPMEILSLLGIKYNKIYTVFSTSALNINYPADIVFLGTSVHPNLVKYFGKIDYIFKSKFVYNN